jgi:DNA-binding MarR family transcriptional regulator
LTPQASLGQRPPALQAWGQLVRAHATVKRDLLSELQEQHGLTMSAYEALFALSLAEGGRLKRVELAERLVLTPSGVTRLLEGLEAEGLVEKVACETDLRISYAQLTDAGSAKLEQASCGHNQSVLTLFEERFSAEEIEALASMLARLPGALDENLACPTDA